MYSAKHPTILHGLVLKKNNFVEKLEKQNVEETSEKQNASGNHKGLTCASVNIGSQVIRMSVVLVKCQKRNQHTCPARQLYPRYI